jgi:S1-C subfamily serine protease
VATLADLMRALQDYKPGDEGGLTVRHGDDERTLSVILGEHNGQPYLGLVPCIGLRGPEAAVFTIHGAPSGAFALITDVAADSPADRAGVQEGDIITAVDGQELTPENTLADVIAGYTPGDKVTLDITRPDADSENEGKKDRSFSVTVELGQHPDDAKKAYLGVHYRSLPIHVRVGEWLDLEDRRFRITPHLELQYPLDAPDGDEAACCGRAI